MIKKVGIKVFPSHARPEDCQRYIDGHRKILEAYGVSQVTSANYGWKDRKSNYLIMVESVETDKLLGGARIQLVEKDFRLPIETAIDNLDPNIFSLVKEKQTKKNGTAEFCGLWNSREVAGYGIGSIVLGRVGVAILDQLNLGSLFALASPATVRYCQNVGFEILHSLGINGTFYYPKEDLLATAMIINDPLVLKNADPQTRELIFSLRENPIQRTIEHGPKGILESYYDITIQDT